MDPAEATSRPRTWASHDGRALSRGLSTQIFLAFLIILAWVVSLFSETTLSDVTSIDDSTQQFEFIGLMHGRVHAGFIRTNSIRAPPSMLMMNRVPVGCDWRFDGTDDLVCAGITTHVENIQIPLWAFLLPVLTLMGISIRRRHRPLPSPADHDS